MADTQFHFRSDCAEKQRIAEQAEMQTSYPKNPGSPASASDQYAQEKKKIMKLDYRFDASPEALGLSKRETEVLSWVIQGKRDSEIGVILEISSRTVEKHVGRILYKLRVENRTTAASIAFAAWQSKIASREHRLPVPQDLALLTKVRTLIHEEIFAPYRA
jgi:DNA-binding CsgD family transcriptional regulator